MPAHLHSASRLEAIGAGTSLILTPRAYRKCQAVAAGMRRGCAEEWGKCDMHGCLCADGCVPMEVTGGAHAVMVGGIQWPYGGDGGAAGARCRRENSRQGACILRSACTPVIDHTSWLPFQRRATVLWGDRSSSLICVKRGYAGWSYAVVVGRIQGSYGGGGGATGARCQRGPARA